MDQMVLTPYHVEGFKLWGPMKDWYPAAQLTHGIGNKSTVSAPSLSSYLRVYQRTTTSLVYNGYKWNMAHYFNPIAIQHFLISAKGGDMGSSPIYQNPGWPLEAGAGPTGL